MSSVGFHIE